MKATVKAKWKEMLIIDWEDGNESGRISLKYSGTGRYELDGEYIGIDRIIEIIKALKK